MQNKTRLDLADYEAVSAGCYLCVLINPGETQHCVKVTSARVCADVRMMGDISPRVMSFFSMHGISGKPGQAAESLCQEVGVYLHAG